MKVTMDLIKLQERLGGAWLLEHPNGSSAWKLGMVKEHLAKATTGTVVFDMCQMGLLTQGPGGRMLPAKKPTKVASNSDVILEVLQGRCRGEHAHAHLEGGGRCKKGQEYPDEFCRRVASAAEILRQQRVESLP